MSVRIKAGNCLKKKTFIDQKRIQLFKEHRGYPRNKYLFSIDNFWKLIGQIEIKFQFHFELWIQKKWF